MIEMGMAKPTLLENGSALGFRESVCDDPKRLPRDVDVDGRDSMKIGHG